MAKPKAVKTAKQITRVKKAVPKVSSQRKPAQTVQKPTKGAAKPKTVGSREPRNPAQRPGSQSIPYQGPGPMGQGVF